MLTVTRPGLQSTLQGAPRVGYRHLGVPYAGPADWLSMSLANRLVGNSSYTTCIEVTYGGFEAELLEDCALAVTGACEALGVSGRSAPVHETLRLRAGETIRIAPPVNGMRAYLAIHSGFTAQSMFGSTSTYLPAGFGGLEGRVLRKGDVLTATRTTMPSHDLKTPDNLRPVYSGAFALRVCESAEFECLQPLDQRALFSESFKVGRQATRMGITLTENRL
ncbi:MAG: allophanate hydrolase subunit 2 family protein, partial [Pseudomonadota bacterium]